MGLKDDWRQFKSAKPGKRFLEQYETNQKERASKWVRVALITLGVVVVLIGLVALPAPGPGILIVAAGVALLARESRWIAERMDAVELKARQLVKKT
jgi:uncharacterized protein (TIGR02611 family)